MAAPTAQEVSKVRVTELIKREEDRFRNARPRSHELWNRARQVLPRGVPSSFQDADPQPVFADHGEGSKVEDAVVVANELARRFKQPQWRFTNSGTESTLDAVRIARGFTGRERLLKIEASYHGHHDALMVSVEPPPDQMGPADAPASFPQSEGI